jgi:hypothetical protein
MTKIKLSQSLLSKGFYRKMKLFYKKKKKTDFKDNSGKIEKEIG